MTTNNNIDNNELADSSALGAGLKSVLKMGHIVFLLLTFAIIGLLGWYFTFSGAFTVTEQERVLVSNFGKLSKTVYTPGWHWNWPSPISDIVRIPVDKQNIVTNAFWLFEDPARPQDSKMEPQASPLKPGRG
jgi:regulator of protease activity HflC (stomatin/prohibitin superfamily)